MKTMSVQRFAIAQFGTRLGTRLEGEHARECLLAALRSLPPNGQLVVTLEGLEVLSTSFSDEMVARAYHVLVSGELGERTMVIETPQLELAEGIDVKLAQRKLAMLCRAAGTWTILGFHTPAMDETLRLILEKGTTTARELADELGLQMSACVNRVARLAQLRLIRREKIGMKGPQDIYALHSILQA